MKNFNQPFRFKNYYITSLGSLYLESPFFSFDSSFKLKDSFQLRKKKIERKDNFGNLNIPLKHVAKYKKVFSHLANLTEKEEGNVSIPKYLNIKNISKKERNYPYYFLKQEVQSSDTKRQVKDVNIWKFNKLDIFSNSFWTGKKDKKNSKVKDQLSIFQNRFK